MHNSITQTFWKQNFDILLLFFLMDLWFQDIGKNGNFGGFWPFSQNVFNMVPWNLVYRHIVYTLRCMWKWLPWAKFSGPFWAKIGRFVGFRLSSRKDSTGFTWNLIYKLFGATFVGVCKRFLWPFWASKWIKIRVFDYFVICSLDSRQSCYICSLELLPGMCTIWDSRGRFGPKRK